MTRVVALTGNVAAGKSAVATLLREWDVPVIDADAIVHELQRPGTPVFKAIRARFGDRVVLDDGELDRSRLRRMILDDHESRAALEAIVHPAVFARRNELLDAARQQGVELVVVDVPLLYEADDPGHYDAVVLVDAPEPERRRRLIELRGLPPDEAERLIAIQMPASDKRRLADLVIENDGSLDRLCENTEAVLARLRS